MEGFAQTSRRKTAPKRCAYHGHMETTRREVGPPVLDTDGLIPLMPFSKSMGFELPLFTTHHVWEEYARHGPYSLCSKLIRVVDHALAGHKADKPHVDFVWHYDKEEGGKAKKVRLRVVLHVTAEGNPWVMLNLGPVPIRLMRGRSTG